MKVYSIEYFIKLFEEIHEEYFSLSSDVNPSDAWEWLEDDEQECLYTMIEPYGLLLAANDGIKDYVAFGNTPKDRVVAFLKYVKRRTEDNETLLQSLQ